jgi:hypothetical protein
MNYKKECFTPFERAEEGKKAGIMWGSDDEKNREAHFYPRRTQRYSDI